MSIRIEDLANTDFADVADVSADWLTPVRPGEVLLEEYLRPMGLSQYRLAKEIGVPARRIGEIVAGKRAITADTALRLAAFFGTDAQSWMNLQTHYDTEVTKRAMSEVLAKIKQFEYAH